jgi:tetratricopeptide (TPR) repeat protein
MEAIVIRPISAAPFLLRAESSPGRAYACRIADLEKVLELDATNAYARWLLSAAKLATGAAAAAEKLAREAVDLDPRNDNYRLQWVRTLKYLARYDQAVAQTRAIIEGTSATPIQRAQALEQMALLASLGSRKVQEQSVPLHNKAIALADPLTTSEDPAVRVVANQLLVGAHLAIAEQIACGDYQDKQKFVAQWISRASALVEQMIEAGEADVSLRMQVAITALDAGAKLDPPIDPKLWIDEVEQAVAAMPSEADDVLAQAEIDWQMGLAYLHAAEISHRRGEADAALDYGAFADAKIGAAQEARKEMPDTQFVLGRLYFQIGAVHAVHRGDHAEACKWYDRAIEPLSRPVPVTPLAAPGQHADALVSMAVSYWETGDRERAYELTGAGMELVEQGIAEGLLTAVALEVPKNNFAAMSRALGRTQLATTPVAVPASEVTQVAERESTAPAKKTVARRTTERSPVRTATRRNSAAGGVQRR